MTSLVGIFTKYFDLGVTQGLGCLLPPINHVGSVAGSAGGGEVS